MITFTSDPHQGDLASCHQALLGIAPNKPVPALITMRRHARSGALDHCLSPATGGGRKLYLTSRLLEHYFGPQQKTALAPEPTPEPASPAVAENKEDAGELHKIIANQSQALRAAIDQIEIMARGLDAVRVELQATTQALASVHREVQGLNGVRQSLMMKYDAAHAGAMDLVKTLREQGGRANGSSSELVLGIMQSDIKIIKNTLNDLANASHR
jgi:hypothetical protein